MSLGYDVAVVGATGVVGEVLLEVLHQRDFPIENLYPLASESSKGSELMVEGNSYIVDSVADFDFSKVQFAFFSAGAAVSVDYVPKAAAAGAVVIDNTSAFRQDIDVPLIIPEVNPEALSDYRQRNIIANPNCSTIQMLVALKPIHDQVGIARVNVATYQAVSGAGRTAIEGLVEETVALISGQQSDVRSAIQTPIAFNVVPKIDELLDNGFTKEEMKMVNETRKILGADVAVNATAVRVPVFYGHSEALHIETCSNIDVDSVRECLRVAPGVQLVDDSMLPTAVTHAAGEDAVFVSRIRQDPTHPNGIDLWVVSDNVRKGAAVNAVQIAEMLVAHDFYR